MARYLLNSPRLTAFGRWRYDGPLTLAQARAFASQPFDSAVGHAATARHLSALLGVPVINKRQSVCMRPGDQALVWQLESRPGEGELLGLHALPARAAAFGLLERLE
jgi:hypothetical protein